MALGCVLMVAGFIWSTTHPGKPIREITWMDLRQLDKKRTELPPALRGLEHTTVRLIGYGVPLEMSNWENVTEFMLVPDPMSCIHVPPPPPNQMVQIKMNRGISMDRFNRAVLVLGDLKISKFDSLFGEVNYAMDDVVVLPYYLSQTTRLSDMME